MSQIKVNIIANILGRFWGVLSTVIFIPVYVKFLGVESYGLVGIFASLQGLMAMADMGLSATLNREMARLSTVEENVQELQDTVRTIEVIYGLIVLLITIIVLCLSPVIAHHWVKSKTLSVTSVESAVQLMSFALAFQIAFSLYQGGLLGLQRQVQLNVIVITMGLLRSVATILVLWRISPRIEAFFLCQAIFSLFQLLWARIVVWQRLRNANLVACFRWSIIRNIRTYAAGILGVTIASTVLLQMDKVILSKMLTLELFGYYTLAWTFSQVPVSVLSGPVYQAVFPQLTQYVVSNDTIKLRELYHQSSQVVSLLVMPVVFIITLFSKECLFLWLGNTVAVNNTYRLAALLAIGSGVSSILILPYALTLAHSWTKLSLWLNIVNIVLLVPLLIFLTNQYGAIGACICWIILNTICLVVFVSLMHRRILIGEQWQWYSKDILVPFLASLLPVLLCRYFFNELTFSRPLILATLVFTWILSVIFTALALPMARKLILTKFATMFRLGSKLA